MNRITQEAHARQQYVEYYLKHRNGTETAIRFKISRKTLYKWLKRYDGTWQSLVERSRRPHRSPRAHTPEEIRQIRRLAKKHHCHFPIREIQTDNGTEFTKALISNDPNDKSLFERKLKEYDILYHHIRIATPRHNGKVERQHRIDQQRFYNHLRMFSLEDGRKQLAVYQKKSNDYIKHCLGLRSPNQVLANYMAVM